MSSTFKLEIKQIEMEMVEKWDRKQNETQNKYIKSQKEMAGLKELV